jgi:hypothetical protein
VQAIGSAGACGAIGGPGCRSATGTAHAPVGDPLPRLGSRISVASAANGDSAQLVVAGARSVFLR